MRLSSRWNRLFSRGDTFEKEAKQMTRIEANKQQPEQRPIGKACSDESGVQSAAITVAGVTFTASQVKSAVVTIEGRDIHIGEKDEGRPSVGFM